MWIIYLTIKDAENKIQEHPIGSKDTEVEAHAFVDGWANAIVTHTEKASFGEVLGMFRIARIDQTELNEKGN